MTRPIPEAEAQNICTMARQGFHMLEIVRASGRSESCIRNTLKRFGVQHVPSANFWNMADLAELERLVADDFPARSVGDLLGRGRHAIRDKLLLGEYDRAPRPCKFVLYLRQSTFNDLARCGCELEMKPHELARVLLRIIERRNLWASLLKVSGEPDELDAL